MKDRINELLNTKKKKIIAGIIVLCLLVGGGIGVYALITPSNNDHKEVIEEIVYDPLTADDIEGYVAGIDDMNVLENATGIDYLKNIIVDEEAIIKVEYNDEEVGLTRAGDYNIYYTITVNTSLDVFAKKEESITIIKTIHVVNQETAQGMADNDEVVYTSDMAVLPKSTGEAVEVEETSVTIKNASTAEKNNSENKKNPTRDTNKNNNSSSSSSSSNKDNNSNSSSSNSSSGNSNNSSSSGNSNSNSNNNNSSSNSNGNTSGSSSSSNGTTTTHTHKWIAVTKTVHHDAVTKTVTVVDQEAYDEPVYESRYICKKCGFSTKNSEEIIDHDCDASYKVGKVQIGTIHHDAVTHQETQIVTPAYDETIVTGYKCSCGATK